VLTSVGRMTNPAEWPALWAAAAASLGVSPVIHPDDLLWPFILGHPAFPTPSDAANYYFADGAESARKLGRIVADHVVAQPHRRPRLLEFASGYGMVSRHLPSAIPEIDVLSCDIHPAAIDFVRDELGGTATLSKHQPEDVSFDEPFDVVFALSFFSHMPATSFGRWLAALYRAVRPGGVLAFTTHGLGSRAASQAGIC
jgi:SAM-dependent methyltransferase